MQIILHSIYALPLPPNPLQPEFFHIHFSPGCPLRVCASALNISAHDGRGCFKGRGAEHAEVRRDKPVKKTKWLNKRKTCDDSFSLTRSHAPAWERLKDAPASRAQNPHLETPLAQTHSLGRTGKYREGQSQAVRLTGRWSVPTCVPTPERGNERNAGAGERAQRRSGGTSATPERGNERERASNPCAYADLLDSGSQLRCARNDGRIGPVGGKKPTVEFK